MKALGRWPRLGLLIGLAASALSLCLVLAARLREAAALPIVHAPFPGAALLAERVQPSGLGAVKVIRRYEAPARYREVVTWYQGKDSLMPLAASARSGCFQQSFRGQRIDIIRAAPSRVVEEVTVCASGGPVAVTSVTTVRFPNFGFEILPTPP